VGLHQRSLTKFSSDLSPTLTNTPSKHTNNHKHNQQNHQKNQKKNKNKKKHQTKTKNHKNQNKIPINFKPKRHLMAFGEINQKAGYAQLEAKSIRQELCCTHSHISSKQ